MSEIKGTLRGVSPLGIERYHKKYKEVSMRGGDASESVVTGKIGMKVASGCTGVARIKQFSVGSHGVKQRR